MRIGIDARELCGRATGVGRYLAGLLLEWAAARTLAHEFVLYAPEPIELPLDARRFATRVVPGPPGTWWEQVRMPRAAASDHLDVWFAPAYSAPLRLQTPIVVAIHDLSFVAHPEWFRIREGARRRWLTRQSAVKASAVITISEFSKRELIEWLDVPEERIHVIPPGIGTGDSGLGPGSVVSQQSSVIDQQSSVVSPQSSVVSRQSPRLRSSDHSSSYGEARRSADGATAAVPSPRVLFVGSIFNRRHVVDLIRSFAPLARAHTDASLDIVGDNRSYPREDLRRTIVAERLDGQVRWREYVTDAELSDLYTQARAFAFLSEYEGLGLTPLEALAAGVPPVLLDTPVARESCGDAAVYVRVRDVAGTTRALESVLFDEATRSRILAAAPAELAKYSWPRAARETLAVLERAG
jgi:glycosyltransferase involved in cell wall biosynthesis